VPSVLLVDDDDTVRDVMREGFERGGYDTVAFADASSALRALAQSTPDLIVTDWQMRGLNGAHVVSAARELQPHAPIVVVSGNVAQARDVVDPNDLSLHLLQKPFAIETLLELADRLTR
jgi:CheY-like chemotaxis protein